MTKTCWFISFEVYSDEKCTDRSFGICETTSINPKDALSESVFTIADGLSVDSSQIHVTAFNKVSEKQV